MPRQIFADEIERFLQGLDGVSSARVLTGPGGEISYVYVTTEGALDSRGLRRGVVAALQSRFGIPVDDRRVRVTQLRAGVQPSEIPHFRVIRVEETATAAELAVTVKLQWARGADVRSATGQARGRAGGAHRPRTLAAATLTAVRDALDVPHADLTLERVSTVIFLDRPVMLVALTAVLRHRGGSGAAAAPQTFVGTAFDDTAAGAGAPVSDEAVEAAITATLDAVARWLLHAAFATEPARSLRRREHLDAMRHFVLDAGAEADGRAEPPGAMTLPPADSPAAAKPKPAEPIPLRPAYEDPADEVIDAAEAGGGRGTIARIAPVRPPATMKSQAVDSSLRNGDYRAGPAHASVETAAVRAEQAKGETAMGLHHDTPEASSGVRAPRNSGVEDGFYRSLVVERTPVHLRCRDGYEVPRAIVRDAGAYALLVETPDGLELFFKHGIISIRVLPAAAAQA